MGSSFEPPSKHATKAWAEVRRRLGDGYNFDRCDEAARERESERKRALGGESWVAKNMETRRRIAELKDALEGGRHTKEEERRLLAIREKRHLRRVD